MDTSNWTADEHIEWMRHHAKTLTIMSRMALNVKFTTMIHYDLPWLNASVSDDLDLLNVQKALMELGPNPVIVRHPESNVRSI